MTNKTQQISVKGLFVRNNTVLLVKDTKGVWEMPGGRIEHGEEPEETLKRELQEELGWTNVDVKDIVDAWSFTTEAADTHYHFIVLTYVCATDEESIRKDSEYTEYRWVSLTEIESLNMRDGYKKTIKKMTA